MPSTNTKENQLLFNKLWKESNWKELETCLLKWIGEDPESHWLLAQLAEVYYLQKQFDKALEYAEKAWKLAPHCPLAIWEYSESLHRLGEDAKAEPLYRGLIRRGVKRIAYGECGEGIRATRMLVNDCYYPLGVILANKGDFGLAKKYITKHITNRNQNCTSLFRLREVKKDLTLITRGIKPTF
jgi:tetratricopeptide (TPR) repeat protein